LQKVCFRWKWKMLTSTFPFGLMPRLADDCRQKFTGQLSGGVARSSQSTWVAMNGRVCRKLILESLNYLGIYCMKLAVSCTDTKTRSRPQQAKRNGMQKWDFVLLEQECRETQTQFKDDIENVYIINNGILMILRGSGKCWLLSFISKRRSFLQRH
jgi:hypothetical protein